MNHEVFCRVQGDELVVVGRVDGALKEIARHELSTPAHPRISDEHYPDHAPGSGDSSSGPKLRALRPRDEAEQAFVALGDGAERWLREACATGVGRIRLKMHDAVELAALLGAAPVDRALGVAALAGRFEDGDLASIVCHLGRHEAAEDLVRADESYAVQPGIGAWGSFGR